MKSSARTAWGPAVWCLLVGMVGSGCSGPAAAEGDSASDTKARAKVEAAPVERSYDTPNVAISDDELAELDGFCAAALECRRTRCDPDAQARAFKAVKVKTQWGKALQKHCAGHPLPGVGRRLAKLVEAEGLSAKSRACHDVAAVFD